MMDASPSAEKFSFTWAGKQHCLDALHTPGCAVLLLASEFPPSAAPGGIFIIGDNLEALKCLLPAYTGRVRLIYIDPPYNTGGDFVYHDDFSHPLNAYLRLTGQAEAGSNRLAAKPETDGRFHSAWLSMMYPRLALARQLLRQDGVICVSIDDHEMPHLRLIMNEIFGEACFKNVIVVRRGVKSVQAQFNQVESLAIGHEYIVIYAKSAATRFRHLRLPLETPKPGRWNNHWRGTERPTMRYTLFGITPERGQWRWSQARSLQAVENYRRLQAELGENPSQAQIDAWWRAECARQGKTIDLLRSSRTGKPEHYVPPTHTRLGSDLWTDLSPRGSADLERLLGCKAFDNPKPVALLRRLVEWITEPQAGDLVLDFFAGSCATAQAVMEANAADGGNRRWMMVQSAEALPAPLALNQPDSSAEILHTIADIGLARIRAAQARLHPPRGVRVFRLMAAPASQEQHPSDSNLLAERLYDLARRHGLGLDLVIETLTLPGHPDMLLYRLTDDRQELYVCTADNLKSFENLTACLPAGAHVICSQAALDEAV